MRVLLAVLLASWTSMALATDPAVDPFNAKSCDGDLMSTGRALDLLGADQSVNLADKDMDETTPFALAYYRFRNKIGGTAGKWYTSTLSTIAAMPTLTNDNGKLRFGLNVFANTSATDFQSVPCTVENTIEKRLRCVTPEGVSISAWGNGFFKGVITNSCARLYSKNSTSSKDEEWVYLIFLK